MRPHRLRRAGALTAGALLLLTAGCLGDEDLAGSSFCDEVSARADAFSADRGKDVPATLIGALREVVDEGSAPEQLRDAYDTITEAGSDEELDAALAEIDRIVAQCGVDFEG